MQQMVLTKRNRSQEVAIQLELPMKKIQVLKVEDLNNEIAYAA